MQANLARPAPRSPGPPLFVCLSFCLPLACCRSAPRTGMCVRCCSNYSLATLHLSTEHEALSYVQNLLPTSSAGPVGTGNKLIPFAAVDMAKPFVWNIPR